MRTRSLFLAALLALAPLCVRAEEGPCVDVEIGDDKVPSYHCLNKELEEKADSVKPPANVPPIGTRSPAVEFGGFNQRALKQQYGPNFGTSAVPYRPQRTYTNLR